MFDPKDYISCRNLFEKYGILLEKQAYDALDTYARLLIAESEHQNVTAVRTLSDIWIRHFLDSTYLLRKLNTGTKIIDIGTGGGIPAIPLAILGDFDITMIDSELRKIEFCKKAVDTLGLTAQTVCCRAEESAKLAKFRGQFDYAVSRAMASGSMLTELSVPFLKVGGSLIAMKGRQYNAETERFIEASGVLGCECFPAERYVMENEEKYLIVVKKLQETPAEYPRRFAKIKRSPL